MTVMVGQRPSMILSKSTPSNFPGIWIEAVHGHAQALDNIVDRLAFVDNLLDRFDLEFLPVTLTTHGTYYVAIMRLGCVYKIRGDSHLSEGDKAVITW